MNSPEVDQKTAADFLKSMYVGIVYDEKTRWSSDFVKSSALCSADFTVVNLDKLKIDFGIINNLKNGLKTAKDKNKQYLIYQEVGNVLMYNFDFCELLYNFLTDNKLQFAGHILDYGNGSFYIHPQYFIIDVEWAITNNITTIEEAQKSVQWQGNVVNRSNENFHDHYTPMLVKGTTEKNNFVGRGRGWNIIDKLAETDSNFLPFPKEIRNLKWFMYPTVKQEATKTKVKILKTSVHTGAFVANTENFKYPDIDNIIKKYQNKDVTIALLASGVLSMALPFIIQADKIILYDSSVEAIQFGRDLLQWDGKNYKDYIRSKEYQEPKGLEYLDYTETELKKLGNEFIDWWNEKKHNVSLIYTNLFDHESYNNLTRHLKDVPTIIHISNVLHYDKNQTVFRTHEKIEMILEFQKKCLTKVSEENFNLYGLNPYQHNRISGVLTEKDLINPIINNVPWRNE